MLKKLERKLSTHRFCCEKNYVKHFLNSKTLKHSKTRFHEVKCYKEGYHREDNYWGALPKHCGTLITDTLVSTGEALRLREITEKMLARYGYQHYDNPESVNIRRVKLHEIFSWGIRDKTLSAEEYDLINKTATAAMVRCL